MAKGITFSITLPETIVKHYDRQAKELGVSRSKIVGTILLNHYLENLNDVNVDCQFCKKGFCTFYEDECVLLSGNICEKQTKG